MVAMPMYAINAHGDRIVIGEYDRISGDVRLFYSKTKDDFATKITVRVPEKLPSNCKKVELFDKDYEGLAVVPIELAQDKIKEAKDGIVKFSKSEIKIIR